VKKAWPQKAQVRFFGAQQLRSIAERPGRTEACLICAPAYFAHLLNLRACFQAGGLTDLSRWLSEAWRATPPETVIKKNRILKGCQIVCAFISGTPPEHRHRLKNSELSVFSEGVFVDADAKRFGVRHSCAAFHRIGLRIQSGRGLPHSKARCARKKYFSEPFLNLCLCPSSALCFLLCIPVVSAATRPQSPAYIFQASDLIG
jgi:hypothetical protein